MAFPALVQNVHQCVKGGMEKYHKLNDEFPPPHQRYLVKRNGREFVATPCYGMHDPLWVPSIPDGEAEPVIMHPDDEWSEL